MSRRYLGATALVVAALAWDRPSASGQAGSSVPKGSKMQTNGQNGLALTAARRNDAVWPLVPEQAAEFDLRLRNQSGAPQSVNSLSGSLFSPVLRLFDASGNGMGLYPPAAGGQRAIGDLSGLFPPPPPRLVTLPPGGEETIAVNLWAHRDPAPPGTYGFDAAHSIGGDGLLTSNRVAFEIVPAQVAGVALSYDSAQRGNSVLAWLATPKGGKAARLLVRISGFVTHATAQVGATALGDFPSDSHLAVSASPPDATFSPALGWVGVISGDKLQLIEHSMSEPRWRAPVATLPVSGAVPVPRFPNRVHAVFLATGSGRQGPALTGVVAQEGEGALKPWMTPLSAMALHSACAFSMEGAIAVLYSSDDGKHSRLHRIDVNENGSVASPDRVLRESSNEVLAMIADLRSGSPESVVVLEADRERHDRLALVKVPMSGEPMAMAPRPMADWPTVEVKGERQPARAQALILETDGAGLPWVAFTDDRGDLIGGRMDGAMTLLREGRISRALFPHIGAVARGVSVSCFNPDGTLFHSGKAAAH